MKKYTILMLLLVMPPLLLSNTSYNTVSKVPKTLKISAKKKRFYHLLVPAIEKVHYELMREFLRIQNNVKYNSGQRELENLRVKFKATTNEELLIAMKPHPKSIVIAQAAMESGWATSRFFKEANNIFGMWSKNKNEPRIAAGIKRNGKHTIWLRKFNSLEDSVRAYYTLMARGKHFKSFRKVRYETDDVFLIVKQLHNYSEMGDFYTKELSSMIRYNQLQKYDIKVY